MSNGAIISTYITRKEACEVTGFSESFMSQQFSIIRANNPNSLHVKGKVNRRDFEHHFNLGNSYRRKTKENVWKIETYQECY